MNISKTNHIRRLLCLVLACSCVWTLFSASISFAARSTGTVKNRILNVRSQASTGSSVVCKLSQGSKVTILSETTGTDGMKWYNVYFAYGGDAKEGYVRADLVNVAGSTGSTASPGGSTNSSLKSIVPNAAIVRSYPSTKAEILTRLFKGTVVTLVNEQAADDGRKWSKVSYQENGSAKEGYIRSDLLTAAPAGSTVTTTTTNTGSTASGASKYINTNVALVRTYASTNGDVRARLVRGTNVTVIKSATGQTDGRTWYKVSYNSNGVSGEGYIRGDLLADGTSPTGPDPTVTTTPGTVPGAPTPVNGTATVIPTVANIRSYASPNGDVRSKLSAGTVVTLISEKTGDDGKKWYKISYTLNGTTMEGYIRSDLLNLGGSGGGTTTTPSNPTPPSSGGGVAQVRSYASPYADVRTTLSNGTKVSIIKEVTGEDGAKWTKISFEQDGKRVEGYVPSSILK